MRKFTFLLIITLSLIGLSYYSYAEKDSGKVSVNYDKSTVKVNNDGTVTIGKKTYNKSKLIKDLKKQLAIANRGIQRINPKATAFTSINVTEDCTATVDCGGGETIECSIVGPGTCESGTISVACISAGHEEHDACGSP